MADIEANRRRTIIREIYDKSNGTAYKDLRYLVKPRTIEKRLHMIDVLLRQPQVEEATRKRLETERLLLSKKHEIYTDSPDIPFVKVPHRLLELSDRRPEDDEETAVDKARNKKTHIITLLLYVYADCSYDELVAIRDAE